MTGVIESMNDDRRSVLVLLDDKAAKRWTLGSRVSITMPTNPRSLQQNAFYWAYLTWCIERGGLKQLGHYSVKALHEDVKAWYMAEHGEPGEIDFTTATLGTASFSGFFDLVDCELMGQFFCIDTGPFHAAYQAYVYWRGEDQAKTFRDYLQEAA